MLKLLKEKIIDTFYYEKIHQFFQNTVQKGLTAFDSEIVLYETPSSAVIKTVYFPTEVIFFFLFILFFIITLTFFSKIHTNLIILLIYIEMVMLLIGIAFATLYLIDIHFSSAIVYSITILALSAAEAVVGLCIILLYFRATKGSIDFSDDYNLEEEKYEKIEVPDCIGITDNNKFLEFKNVDQEKIDDNNSDLLKNEKTQILKNKNK